MTNSTSATKIEPTDAFIGEQRPAWLRKATPAQINDLRDRFSAHRLTEQALQAVMQGLLPIDVFARTALEKALDETLGLKLDLRSVLWRERWVNFSLPGNQAINAWESFHPALHHLLQNFPDAAKFGAGSGLVNAAAYDDPHATLLYDDPQAIAGVCRALNIGERYQTHLNKIFDAGALHLLAQDKQQRFALAVEMAALQQELASADIDLLRLVASGKPAFHAAQDIVKVRQLALLGHSVEGALTVELGHVWPPRTAKSALRIDGVILYQPDQPLRRFASWNALQAHLLLQLRNSTAQAQLIDRIALKHRADCLALLALRLKDAVPDLQLHGELLTPGLFDAWAQAHVERLREDARYLAVPTADVDAAYKWAKIKTLESVGESLVQVAGMFVPVLNTLLLGTMVVDVLKEAFEGVNDWARGHQHEALEHFLGVAENLAVNAVLAAGGHYVLRGFKRSAWVDGLVPVSAANGRSRLWQDSLAAFRVDELPAVAQVGENGFYSDGVLHWWAHQGQYYAVEHVAAAGQWRLRRADGSSGFAPALLGNGERAWQLAWQRPQEWQGVSRLLTHLWPEAVDLQPGQAEQILRICAIDEACLRGLAVERRCLPVRLRDSLIRFRASARIDAFFVAVEQHGAQLLDPALFDFCLEQLPTTGDQLDEQYAALIADAAQLRQRLMVHLTEPRLVGNAQAALLQRDFPGLAPAYVEDLLSSRNAGLIEQMSSRGRVPLALAEQARASLQAARLTRAQEALLLGNSYSDDLPELVFGLLRRHAGWPQEANFEVREGSEYGRVLARLYPAQAGRAPYTLVWRNGVFDVSVDGRENLGTLEAPADLFASLLAHLPQSHRLRLGWAGDQGPAAMRRDLYQWLPIERSKLLGLMGMRPIRPWRSPGRRMADGRYGYALSGRSGGAAHSTPERTLRNRVRALYPGFSAQQVELYIDALENRAGSVFTALLREEQEFMQLDQSLQTWVQTAHPPQAEAARRLIADELRRVWRLEAPLAAGPSELPGVRLSLIGVPVHELPVLPETVSFRHVQEIHLVNLRLSELPVRFLGHFRRLQSLNLSRNRLTTLPAGLEQLAQLRILNLARNTLQLDAGGYTVLAGLPRLRYLDLSHNPLQAFSLPFEQLSRLYELNLRATGLQQIPADLDLVQLLEDADLRDNAIAELPGELLQAPLELRRALRLEGNPLPGDYRQTLLGEQAPVITRQAQALPARERWLERLQGAAREARAGQWDRLREEDDSAAFFGVLEELVHTSDFRLVREDLERRVWALLDSIENDTQLRAEIFHSAAYPEGCVDSMAAAFSALQVRAHVFVSLRDLPLEQAVSGRLAVARTLFRLDRVQRYAREDMQRRAGAEVDEVEVDLAYRVGLAKALDLPGQPRTMQFARIAGVSQEDLDAAAASVRLAEASDQLALFISERWFWKDYLRSANREPFEAIRLAAQRRMSALDEQASTLAEFDYLAQGKALVQERKAQYAALLLKLTQEALAAEPPVAL